MDIPGEIGSKRKRGRPPARLSDAQLGELGAPPFGDPLGTAAWTAQALARLALWGAAGAAPPAVLERTRQLLVAASRAVPAHVLGALDRELKREDQAIAAPVADVPVREASGDSPAIRRNPA